MVQVPLNREALERAARLYASTKDAALALGCTRSSLLRAFRREGIIPRWRTK